MAMELVKANSLQETAAEERVSEQATMPPQEFVLHRSLFALHDKALMRFCLG